MTDILSPAFLAVSLLVSATAGVVGAFALMRRMILAADPISHIALPGIGLALLYGWNPLVGGAATLLLGAVLIWAVEQRTKVNADAIIGVVFAASLALGALITPEEELVESLFGSIRGLGRGEIFFALAVCAAVALFVARFRHHVAVALISPDLARAAGVNAKFVHLAFFVIFVLAIILGLRFIGALLMGSLLIIPAAIARNIARGFSSFLAMAAGSAVIAMLAGAPLAASLGFALGPTVIAVASALFFMSMFFIKK